MTGHGWRLALRRAGVASVATVVAAPLVLTTTAPTAAADQTYYVPVTKTWTIKGHGYGHGHGLSQHGAQGAAIEGLTHRQIINFYYPGTNWSKVRGNVRVLISADTTSDLQVRKRRGLSVTDLGAGQRWTLPARDSVDAWRMTPSRSGPTAVQFHNRRGWHTWKLPNGRKTLRGDGQFSANGPLTLLVPSGSGVTGKRYRGVLRSVRPYRGAASRDTVNVLPMDSYVRGVVPYEMPTSWRPQALRAQAVAARTYAAWQRAQNPKRYYQICDTTSCQVYGGVGAEVRSSNAAVKFTRRQILTTGGKAAFTQFSASSGGWTSYGGVSYMPAKKDPYDAWSGNTVHNWSTKVGTTSLQNAHPEIGKLIDVRVTRREGNGQWGGRVQQLVLEGSRGRAYMTGDDFRWHYGLRSSWFAISPTPIMARWRKLGGMKNLGRPRTGEYPVSTGAAQKFERGRVYWNRRTGAREVRGPLLSAYVKWGGPKSNLGWPRTGTLKAQNRGYKVKFQRGAIYHKKGPGPHVLYGAILKRWGAAGAAGSWMGYPVTNVFKIKGGLRAKFQRATISWDRSSNRTRVRRR